MTAATSALEGRSVAEENELLFQNGINFNDLPSWQKRGVGLFWETYEKFALNPLTGEAVVAQRRRLKVELGLPMREEYEVFLRRLLASM